MPGDGPLPKIDAAAHVQGTAKMGATQRMMAARRAAEAETKALGTEIKAEEAETSEILDESGSFEASFTSRNGTGIGATPGLGAELAVSAPLMEQASKSIGLRMKSQKAQREAQRSWQSAYVGWRRSSVEGEIHFDSAASLIKGKSERDKAAKKHREIAQFEQDRRELLDLCENRLVRRLDARSDGTAVGPLLPPSDHARMKRVTAQLGAELGSAGSGSAGGHGSSLDLDTTVALAQERHAREKALARLALIDRLEKERQERHSLVLAAASVTFATAEADVKRQELRTAPAAAARPAGLRGLAPPEPAATPPRVLAAAGVAVASPGTSLTAAKSMPRDPDALNLVARAALNRNDSIAASRPAQVEVASVTTWEAVLPRYLQGGRVVKGPQAGGEAPSLGKVYAPLVTKWAGAAAKAGAKAVGALEREAKMRAQPNPRTPPSPGLDLHNSGPPGR